MARSAPLRRKSLRVQRDSRGTAEFAMMQPKASARFTSMALQKVSHIKAPLGVAEAWQRDAFGYYEMVGELSEALQETAKSVARCDFRPVQVIDETSPGGVKDTDDPRVLNVWEAFTSPSGDKNDLYYLAALNLQITGESYLVGSPLYDDYGDEAGFTWEFLSNEEILVQNAGSSVKRVYNYGGMAPVELSEETYIARMHRPDPRYTERADCAVKHVLPILNEIITTTQVIDAILNSRLSAGGLFVPDELSYGPFEETEDDSDEIDEIDPFTRELIEQITAPIQDKTSAAALVPLIIRGAAELGDSIKLIDFARNLDALHAELRQEALKRLAIGLDIPIEIMFGKGNLAHWGAYNVDANFITRNIEPLGIRIANFITTAYLRPMLIEQEGMSEEEARTYRIFFDAARITSRTDAGPAARAGYDRGVISELSYVREMGLDESDMPSPEERMRRDVRMLMEKEPIIFGPQAIGWLHPKLEDVFKIPETSAANQGRDNPANPTGLPERNNHTGPKATPVTDNETGQDEPVPRGPAGPREEEALIDRLTAGANSALNAALEQAGARLREKMANSARFSSLEKQTESFTAKEVVARMSEADFMDMDYSVESLFEGAFEEFAETARADLREYFADKSQHSIQAAEYVTNAYIDMLNAILKNAMACSSPAPDVPSELAFAALAVV